VANWRMDAEVRQCTRNTLANRRVATERLLWFLRERGFERCGPVELRSFFVYLNSAHETPEGRWGNSRRKRPLRPVSAQFYYDKLKTFFNFVVAEGAIDRSPMATMKSPVVRQDQVQPFTTEQVEALRSAARRSRHPRRDEAILLFLLDTGARASEVCGLRVRDLDLNSMRCTVRGKGNKDRALCFGVTTRKAL
jgi:site-specific recombinase XerD